MKNILITGVAGFIGYHLAEKLISQGYKVVGIDNLNEYYDINLKLSRLRNLGILSNQIIKNTFTQSKIHMNFSFHCEDISNYNSIVKFITDGEFDVVINLAAQAGVRYSIENPLEYTNSNITGFLGVLEGCRYGKVKNLIYASSSSVYGLNTNLPLKENMVADHPMSLYAATKKANEVMAHSYSSLYGIPTIGLRFFTVYGPWGRPDMALFKFTKAIINNENIQLYNNGNMIRDFTYVDDIVESISRLVIKPAESSADWNSFQPNSNMSKHPFRLFNIGNGSPIILMKYVNALEKALNKQAKFELLEMQLGDVSATHSDCSSLDEYINFKPNTDINFGVEKFVDWYLSYYK